jgi:hypothetical protein
VAGSGAGGGGFAVITSGVNSASGEGSIFELRVDRLATDNPTACVVLPPICRSLSVTDSNLADRGHLTPHLSQSRVEPGERPASSAPTASPTRRRSTPRR